MNRVRQLAHTMASDELALAVVQQQQEGGRASAAAGGVSEALSAALSAAFGRVDRNVDGHVTRAELVKALRGDDELQAMLSLPAHISDGQRGLFESVFQAMDTDGDREVSLDEFVGYLAAQQQSGGEVAAVAPPRIEDRPDDTPPGEAGDAPSEACACIVQ